MNESKGFRRAGLVLSLVWLALCIFPLWWVLITAFKLPIAVSGGTTYLVDFHPELSRFFHREVSHL